jgi:hypothetical protein
MTHAEVFLTHKDAVLKFSYRFNNQKDTSLNNFVTNTSNNQTTHIDNNGFLFIAATYF